MEPQAQQNLDNKLTQIEINYRKKRKQHNSETVYKKNILQ